MRIDLHSHSNASDGTEPPGAVMRRAAAAGLDVIALTDHDTVAGWPPASQAVEPGLTLVPGMELSCHRDGMTIHMLAYLFDPSDTEFADECVRIRNSREERGREMVRKLAELGVPITWRHVTDIADGAPVGRPHIARALVSAGVIDEPREAFTPEWIGTGGRAHVSRYGLDPARAVRLIRAAGGVAVLAHPKSDRRGRVIPDQWIAELAQEGLFGIEVDHADHPMPVRTQLRGLAKDLGLAVTGSSDDHGTLTGHRLGSETTDPTVYECLLAAATGNTPTSG